MNNRKFKTGLKTSINDFEDLAPHEAWKDEVTKLNEKRDILITKLIEKYESENLTLKMFLENNELSGLTKPLIRAKIELYNSFISDLKELQNTL